MRKVTKEEFFATVGPLNVHPRVDMASLKTREHASTWEDLNTRRVVGRTVSDSWGIEPIQCFLS